MNGYGAGAPSATIARGRKRTFRNACDTRRDLLKALVACSGVHLPHAVAGEPSIFREVAAQVGLNFHHFNFATGHHYMPEIMGAGVALIDYDNDGYMDDYLTQGKRLDRSWQLLFPLPTGWKPGQ